MKTLKNYVWMAIGSALLIAVISGMTAGPALAQLVKAALVKNVDERGRVPYQEVVTCVSTGFGCQAQASAVPPGKRLVIEHVSMRIIINNSTGTPEAGVFGNAVVQYLNPILSPTGGTTRTYFANEAVLTYYETGQAPYASVFLSSLATSMQVVVTFSGYSVDLTL
jgi:hypothetical protein